MAKKSTSIFVCQECGSESPKWMGQCAVCGAWNSLVEEKVRSEPAPGTGRLAARSLGQTAGPIRLSDISSGSKDRCPTGLDEMDRVLGGGIVKGSLILIAGEPGIGKSTLILQTAMNIAKTSGQVLYISGEESEEQIRMRADRLTETIPQGLLLLAETNLENAAEVIDRIKPVLLVVDSIQTMYSDSVESAAGSVSQVRTCTNELMRLAKSTHIPAFIVAHVTKSGELAGPKIIEHLVDCVLQFAGDRNQDLRILRANKNRFGTTSEIGAFEMREEGLVQISDLSGTLLEDMDAAAEGSVATAVYEGTRPLLLEMQALTAASGPGFARRTPLGVELARLNMIIAVLERKAGLDLSTRDVYVNVVGGIRPEGTSIDLAVALAIWSSARSVAVPPHTLIIGEIGLTGELRSVRNADKILGEAAKLGFTTAILPKKNADKASLSGIRLIGVTNIAEAIRALTPRHSSPN